MSEEKFEGVVLWAPERHKSGTVFFKISPCRAEDYTSVDVGCGIVSIAATNPIDGKDGNVYPIVFLGGQSGDVALEYLKPGAFVSGSGKIAKREFVNDLGETQISVGIHPKSIDFRSPDMRVDKVKEAPPLERDHSYEM